MQAKRHYAGRPELSDEARTIGEARRREREEVERADRQIENLEILIRKVCRRIR
jgi:hypothetical protein